MTPKELIASARALINGGITYDAERRAFYLAGSLADALEAAERERDTARAQVETLAGALRWYENLARHNSFPSAESIEIWNDRGNRARAALKAARVEP